MKKMIKLGKIFLLIATVFSYVASPISVLAEEITKLPFSMELEAVDSDEDNYIDNYKLSYVCENEACDAEKEYTIKLTGNLIYNNEDFEDEVVKSLDPITGDLLNEVKTHKIELSNSLSKYYGYTYNLDVVVLEGEEEVYNKRFSHVNDVLSGLTGKLNGVLEDAQNVVIEEIDGNYNVTTKGEYTQNLSILPGELSPKAEYRILVSEATENTDAVYSIMSAQDLAEVVFEGTKTDLTGGKLAGVYAYTDSVTFEEVSGNDVDGYTTVKTYTYSYDATIKYGTNNDSLFNGYYNNNGVVFENGNMTINAKGYKENENIITIQELINGLQNNITLEVLDENGNKLYPEETVNDGIQTISEEDSVLDSEVKNGYTVKFTNGATASYTVVVVGDANSDNEFTHEDLVGVIEGYINEEDMPSMGMIYSEDVNSSEEMGSLTFEDVIVTNELLKEEPEMDREEEDNEKLELGFGKLSEDVYVGDTIEIDVLLNEKVVEEMLEDNSENQEDVAGEETTPEEEVLEFIEGIDGNIKLSDNLKIKEIKFNEVLTGSYNEEGRLVAVGDALTEEAVVMTLVLEVTSLGEGKASVQLSGSTSKFLNIDEFEAITTEFEVIRRLSTNNNLSSLSANVGTFDIDFNSEETIYTLTVPYTTESVEISGLVEDEYAEVEGLGVYELKEDKTTALITVTAEDGTTKVYTIYIVKEAAPALRPIVYYYSSNNYLKSLVVDGYELEFDKYTNEYKITVKNDVTSLDISALAEDSRSRVEITGNGDFKVGENVVTISVTAENGSVREYKLIVDKQEKAALEEDSNTAEKIVIIVLIILVVLGLLYLIFKKDEDDTSIKREDPRTKNDNKEEKNNVSKKDNVNNKNKKNGNKNNKK